MAKSYKKQSMMSEAKFYLSEAWTYSKIKILITITALAVCLITGVVLAFKYNSNFSINLLQDYGIVTFVGRGITSSFFSRLLSILLIMVILFGCSFSKYLMPLAVVVLAFRSYLLGFNLCLMFLTYGVPGIFLSLFIFLPCHLVIMFLFCAYYFLLIKARCDCQTLGCKNPIFKISIIFFVLFVGICLIETLLLLIFNASVIIVI